MLSLFVQSFQLLLHFKSFSHWGVWNLNVHGYWRTDWEALSIWFAHLYLCHNTVSWRVVVFIKVNCDKELWLRHCVDSEFSHGCCKVEWLNLDLVFTSRSPFGNFISEYKCSIFWLDAIIWVYFIVKAI